MYLPGGWGQYTRIGTRRKGRRETNINFHLENKQFHPKRDRIWRIWVRPTADGSNLKTTESNHFLTFNFESMVQISGKRNERPKNKQTLSLKKIFIPSFSYKREKNWQKTKPKTKIETKTRERIKRKRKKCPIRNKDKNNCKIKFLKKLKK